MLIPRVALGHGRAWCEKTDLKLPREADDENCTSDEPHGG